MKKQYVICFLFFLSASFTLKAQWQALSGPPGGTVSDIEIDASNKLYSVVDSKLYSSSNDAATWQKVATTPAALTLIDLMIDGTAMYALNYSLLMRSDDGGATWTKTNANTTAGQFTGVNEILKIANNVFAIYGYGGLYISTDTGATWIKIDNRSVNNAVVNTTGDLFVADNEGIKRHLFAANSLDWKESNLTMIYPKINSGILTVSIKKSNGTLFANTNDDIIKSVNNGNTWIPTKNNITESYFYGARWADSPDGKMYFCSISSRQLYATADDGTTWSLPNALAWPGAAYTNSYIQKLIFISPTKAFAATEADGVFKTINSGLSWTMESIGLNFSHGSEIEITSSGRIMMMPSYSHGYWYSDNNGGAWTFKSLSNIVSFSKLTRLASNNTCVAQSFGYYSYYSIDNGNNWIQSPNSFYDITANSAANKLYGIYFSKISSSGDGAAWTDISVSGLPVNYQGLKITIDDAELLYVYLNNNTTSKKEVYKITLSTPTAGIASKLALPLSDADKDLDLTGFFANNNKIYYSTYNSIYVSTNQGTDWSIVPFSNTKVFGIIDGIRKGICASTARTLYITQDDGQSWNSSALPLENYAYVNDIAVDASGDFYSATYNGNVLKNTSNLLADPASLPPYIDFNWQPTDGPYGGYVGNTLTDNSNNTYALSAGSIFKTINFNTWQNISSNFYFYDLALDNLSNKLYAVTYNELLTSIDGGIHWTILNNENFSGRYYMRRCNNGDIVIAANNSGFKVYVSTDGGATFGAPKYTLPPNFYIYDLQVTTTNGIFIKYYDGGSGFQIKKSIDRGVTWSDVSLPLTNLVNTSTDENGNIFLTNSSSIYKSADNTNFTLLTTNIKNPEKIYVSPLKALYVAGVSNDLSYGIYKSADGGANWNFQKFTPTDPINKITWVGARMVLTTNKGVYISDDDGATFTPKNVGITGYGLIDLEISATNKLLTADNTEIFLSSDLQSWTKTSKPFTKFIKKPDGTLIGISSHELWHSADGGTTWIKISTIPGDDWIQSVATIDGISFFAVTEHKIWFTNDLITWTELAPTGLPDPSSIYYSNIAVNPNGILYVSLNTVSGIREAYQILFGSAQKLNMIKSPVNIQYRDNKIFIFDLQGAIFSTSDGVTWEQTSAPAGDKLIITSNNYFFIPTYGGKLWLSRDKGKSWQNVGLSDSFSNNRFVDVVINEANGYAYAIATNSAVLKSASIVIPNDNTNPVTTAFSPINNATGTSIKPALSITFDEIVVSVANKKIRILDLSNAITPVELIDVTAGTQDGKTITFTPTTQLSYNKTYFIIVDNGALTDIFGNPFTGISSNSIWRFTTGQIPDIAAPSIAFSPSVLTKGLVNKLQVTVTDNAGGSGVKTNSVKIFYRGVLSSELATEAFLTATANNGYEVLVPDAWLDELGLEYYFTASDIAGNAVRSPTTGEHRSYITFNTANTPTIPQLPAGGTESSYRIISVPYNLADNNVSTVFSELGPANKAIYRLLTYNGNNSWTEYPEFTTINRGTGYWINSKQQTSLTIDGATTPANNKTGAFSLQLKPGWNQIGNPYPFSISWNAVKTAAANTNIGILKTYDSQYKNSDVLKAFEGGFVFLNGTTTVSLPILISARSAGRIADPGGRSEQGWLVPFTLRQGDVENPFGGVGMHPEASDSFDQFDDLHPPRFMKYLELNFAHPEHMVKQFARDIVSPRSDHVWEFTVGSNLDGIATLQWDNADFSESEDLYLYDMIQMKPINMKTNASHTFDPKESNKFKIYYGKNVVSKMLPDKAMLGNAYPNPTTGAKTTFAFILPESGGTNQQIKLELFDQLGKPLAVIKEGEFTAGYHEIEWKNEENISSGLYLFRVNVVNNTGQKNLYNKLMLKQ